MMIDRHSAMRSEEHDRFETLLPWYVTGRLAPDEVAGVEAHLATCAACRGELAGERVLRDEIAALPMDQDAGWNDLRSRLGEAPRRRRLGRARQAVARALARPGRLIGFVAAQAAAIALVVVIARAPVTATYRALGSAPPGAMGNVMIVFQPQATEGEIRRMLNTANATIVGGPTDADAYILRVPAASRADALVTLRRQSPVVLAEPIDGESQP